MPATTLAATTLADRALLRLAGEDVRGFLQGLVTNDLDLLAPERPLWAALLTPQGKVLFDFILWDVVGQEGGDVLLDCEGQQLDGLRRRLSMYRLRRAITIERDDSLAVHWSLDGSGTSDPQISDPRLADLGRRWLAPPGEPATGWLGHRLSLGVTEGAEELGSDVTLWLEASGAELNGTSFTKGCYVGQENTARMHYRSKVNRRLVVVPTDTPGERSRKFYPELGLSVEHRRVDALEGALIPAWLARALA